MTIGEKKNAVNNFATNTIFATHVTKSTLDTNLIESIPSVSFQSAVPGGIHCKSITIKFAGYVLEVLSNNSCRVTNHSINILAFFQVLARQTNVTDQESICIYSKTDKQ